MKYDDHTITRRGVLKLTGTVPFAPALASEGTAAEVAGTDIVLESNEIPNKYTEIDHNPIQADFYQELSRVYQGTEEADVASRVYLNPDLPSTGIGSTAYVFDDPPRPRTVYQTMAECFDGFAEELAGDAKGTVTTRTDAIGTEWYINIPDPDWYPESGFSDVTRLEVVNGVVLATVVYGPTTGETHPRKRARHLSAEMRSRVREEVTGSYE